jgi:hypothetical protein
VTSRAATAALQRQATTIVKIVRVIATGSYHFAVAVRRAKASESRCEGLGATDVHRSSDGKRYVVRADENLTAFLELESATRFRNSQRRSRKPSKTAK